MPFFKNEDYTFEFIIDGVTKVSFQNNNPTTFTDTKVYVGDNVKVPLDALIRNFYVTTSKNVRTNYNSLHV